MRRALLPVLCAASLAVGVLAGCESARPCDDFYVDLDLNVHGAATPRDAVDAWLKDGPAARDRDAGAWHATDDPLKFSNGGYTVVVADLSVGDPGSTGFMVTGCR